ncbi:transcription termination/antitermination protein NusA [Candidatus Kuenenbacteria bacterium HGW-Kuenenbacteria-1]|uniref:Transcription termination/antitermination protein NusA n=1 Tax=Candidatus Kuenenbacteria bacterium HGW-Kuenenbacteria-1 TaxID=2013812 RepID=A0A2N1UNM1_9BACT|nr:MAG: transcription termination/antitermination protein NusA [Candidatus Kuenenbacteria bacterium HGW-Kuenenbacteria-1]
MSSPILIAIKQICDEKNISAEKVIEAIELSLAAAFRKDFGQIGQNIKAKFDVETGNIKIFDIKTVVNYQPEEETKEIEKSEEEFKKKKFNPKTDIYLEEAKKIKKNIKINDEIKTELEISHDFGRIAAQTAKQVIVQNLREMERESLYEEFKDKEGKVLNGIIQRFEGRNVIIDLGRTIGLLPVEEQIPFEKYNAGQRLKVFVLNIEKETKGPKIIVSRTHKELLKQLFYLEIPEISNDVVEIKAIAREAGARSKIAVFTKEKNIDPVGSCIGQKGTRIQTIISELNGEKIDIIEYSENISKFISNALSPAKVIKTEIDKKNEKACVMVREDQLSLAIGKDGQNVRLAAKLTGWKIDIIAQKEEAKENKEEEEERIN